jgi:hypothetical protein
MKQIHYIGITAAALTAATPGTAFAGVLDETASASNDIIIAESANKTPITVETAVTVTRPELSWPAPANLVSDVMLGEQRGTATITVGNQTLEAINSGNTLNGGFTAGEINLTDNAFSGFNGFGNLVINTGAQNNLQSGMNVTLNFAN